MSLPSEKYKKHLLPIKKQLMKEIASYFEYGKFEMATETVMGYQTNMGEYAASFDTIIGDETNFRLFLRSSSMPNITVLGFKAEDTISIEKDIPFLMSLLDYVNMDAREVRKEYAQKKYEEKPFIL